MSLHSREIVTLTTIPRCLFGLLGFQGIRSIHSHWKRISRDPSTPSRHQSSCVEPGRMQQLVKLLKGFKCQTTTDSLRSQPLNAGFVRQSLVKQGVARITEHIPRSYLAPQLQTAVASRLAWHDYASLSVPSPHKAPTDCPNVLNRQLRRENPRCIRKH
eukprot:3119612-Amphidinium_carterae.1